MSRSAVVIAKEGLHIVGIRSDDGNTPEAGFQREDLVIVLQKYDRFTGGFDGLPVIGFRTNNAVRDRGIRHLVVGIEHAQFQPGQHKRFTDWSISCSVISPWSYAPLRYWEV